MICTTANPLQLCEECVPYLPCAVCNDLGFLLPSWDLGPTHSCPDGRAVTFNPFSHRVMLTRKKKVEQYRLTEFNSDRTECRAFRFEKISTGEVSCVEFGPGVVYCDCRGFQSDSSRKADQVALDTGREIFFTLGCSHLDFVFQAMPVGLLDVSLQEIYA